VVSGLIDAVIRQGVKVFTRPLSLPGRIIWRIVRNGYSLYRGMEGINRGIKFGEGPATRVKERFIKNLLYKATLRVALSLSPATALGLAGLGTLARLVTEDNYLKKFVTDTLDDLPEDMFWRGAYTGAYEIYHRIFWGDAERKAAENEEWIKTYCPLEISPENGPRFTIEGDLQFRFAIRVHFDELQKHKAGRALLAQMKNQKIKIRPPHDDDFLRMEPDGSRYYGSRVVSNTIHFDPYNTFYGKSREENTSAFLYVDPSIVLFHELLHIQTGETGHQHIVPSDPQRLDENDYRREYYASRKQDVIERAWDPVENDFSVASYVSNLSGGNLTPENISPQQWYINRKINDGYSGIKLTGSLSFPLEEGEIIDSKLSSRYIVGQSKSSWNIYLNGKYWPVTEDKNNKLSVKLGDEDRNLELVPGSTKKWRLTDDDDIWDKYYADHVLYELPSDFTESEAINYLKQVRKGESRHYRKVEHFSGRVQIAVIKQQETITQHESMQALPETLPGHPISLDADTTDYAGRYYDNVQYMRFYSAQVVKEKAAEVAKNVEAENAYAERVKYISDLHQQFNKIENTLSALSADRHVYDEKIAGLKNELKILTESEVDNLRADASQRQALLKYEINYLLWLRKQLDDEFKIENRRLNSPSDLPFSKFSDNDRQKAFYDAMKYVLRRIENDPKLPPTSRANAYEARMGKERVTPVDIYGYPLLNCFFIPDEMGSKYGVLIDFDSEGTYYYVQEGQDLKEEISRRFASHSPALGVSVDSNYQSTPSYFLSGTESSYEFINYTSPIALDIQRDPDGPEALKSLRSGALKYEQQFNSNDPIRTDIKTLSGQMAKQYDRSENKAVRKLAIAGESIDDADFNATIEIYTGDENKDESLTSYYLHHISNPAEYMAWSIQSAISIKEGDSVEVARKKITRAKRIGQWVDVTASAALALVPGGQYVLLTQAIAGISADISNGKTPDGLALASALVGILPQVKIVKYVGRYGSVAAGGVKYGIMISGHVIDIIGMYRSLSLAIETKDPLHIYQACISAGLSAKAAWDTSKKIFKEIRSPKNSRPKVSPEFEDGSENIQMSTFRISPEASEGRQETSFITYPEVAEGTGSANSNRLKVIQRPDGGYENAAMDTSDDIQSGHHVTGGEQLEGAGSTNSNRLKVIQRPDGGYENAAMETSDDIQSGHHVTGGEQLEGAGSANNKRLDVSLASKGTGSANSNTLKAIPKPAGGHENIEMATSRTSQEVSEGTASQPSGHSVTEAGETRLAKLTSKIYSDDQNKIIEDTTSKLKEKLGPDYSTYAAKPIKHNRDAVVAAKNILNENGYTDIRVVEMGIWANGRTDAKPVSHYVVMAKKGDVEIVVDLTAGRFKKSGFYEPYITTKDNWVARWQAALSTRPRVLAKYVSVNGEPVVPTFNPSSPYSDARKVVPGGVLLQSPAWYQNANAATVPGQQEVLSVPTEHTAKPAENTGDQAPDRIPKATLQAIRQTFGVELSAPKPRGHAYRSDPLPTTHKVVVPDGVKDLRLGKNAANPVAQGKPPNAKEKAGLSVSYLLALNNIRAAEWQQQTNISNARIALQKTEQNLFALKTLTARNDPDLKSLMGQYFAGKNLSADDIQQMIDFIHKIRTKATDEELREFTSGTLPERFTGDAPAIFQRVSPERIVGFYMEIFAVDN